MLYVGHFPIDDVCGHSRDYTKTADLLAVSLLAWIGLPATLEAVRVATNFV